MHVTINVEKGENFTKKRGILVERSKAWLYKTDCHLFYLCNEKIRSYLLFKMMGAITHLGGATATILSVVILSLINNPIIRPVAIASAASLIFSHIIVSIIKKGIPRLRPYIVLPNANVVDNPFKDHSFPSGHTTAIFSVTTPFMLILPFTTVILLPLAILVGLSRIVLGLHYPSDVIAGALLGTSSALGIVYLCQIVFNLF